MLVDGDIVNVDVTTIYKGFYGDTSARSTSGRPAPRRCQVTEVARERWPSASRRCARARAAATSAPGHQEYVEAQGLSVVRDFVGHGIGRRFHEDPQVKHYGRRGAGERLRAGMTFTIEPMVNVGHWEVHVDPKDKWTVTTADGSLSAQFEHTVLVTKTGVEVLTDRDRPLARSENVAGAAFA